jgi:hypothetical protein
VFLRISQQLNIPHAQPNAAKFHTLPADIKKQPAKFEKAISLSAIPISGQNQSAFRANCPQYAA